ncbi:hypothetical protein H0H92_004360 [Tricholoma furcatifolium]|nr:hypothetical protein H0H92_004360 [Tricholoma furcatifolium]
MKLVSSLLPFVLLSLSLSSSARVLGRGELAAVPLTRTMNTDCLKNLIACEEQRIKSIVEGAIEGIENIFGHTVKSSITNSGVSYTASIGIGSPATTYNVIVDTGSSNLWVGAQSAYVVTSTSVKTDETLVKIAPGLVLTHQTLGAVTNVKMLGYSYSDPHLTFVSIGAGNLTVGTLSPSNTSSVPTVVDTAYEQGLISGHEIGVYFEPYDAQNTENGELSWGGPDSSKYTGELTYADLTTTSPSSLYWGVDAGITYNGVTLLNSAGIVDTGTTLVQIATDAFQAYQKATGAVPDSNTGLLSITEDQYNNLKPLNFVINGQTFAMSANAQVFPRALNSAIGGTADGIYLVIADIGTPSGSGLDFIAGYGFLERFYTVYDTTNHRVGFATTAYTDATSN